MSEKRLERLQELNAAAESPALELELCKRYIQDFPDDAFAWWRAGWVFAKFSRFVEAEHAFRRSLQITPKERHFHISAAMGRMFQDKGDDGPAEQWYRKSIEQNPKDAHGYIYLGALLARRGRLDEAERTHRHGTECKTGCIDEAWYNLGLVLRAQERYEEAESCFEKALSIDPNYRPAKAALRDVRQVLRLQRRSQ